MDATAHQKELLRRQAVSARRGRQATETPGQVPTRGVVKLAPNGTRQTTRQIFQANKSKTASTFGQLKRSYRQGFETGTFRSFITSLFSQ